MKAWLRWITLGLIVGFTSAVSAPSLATTASSPTTADSENVLTVAEAKKKATKKKATKKKATKKKTAKKKKATKKKAAKKKKKAAKKKKATKKKTAKKVRGEKASNKAAHKRLQTPGESGKSKGQPFTPHRSNDPQVTR